MQNQVATLAVFQLVWAQQLCVSCSQPATVHVETNAAAPIRWALARNAQCEWCAPWRSNTENTLYYGYIVPVVVLPRTHTAWNEQRRYGRPNASPQRARVLPTSSARTAVLSLRDCSLAVWKVHTTVHRADTVCQTERHASFNSTDPFIFLPNLSC